MPLLEKAGAKLFGNYEMLSGGLMGPAVQMLTGAPYFDTDHGAVSSEDLWTYINDHLARNWMITCASHFGSGSDQDQNKIGVPFRHAFTVMDTAELSDGTKLIQIRNPWGKETYHGPWSDKSDKWTEALAADVGGVKKANDGVWWISADDYRESFWWTTANPDVQDEVMSHYAVYELDTPSLVSHKLNLASSDDQTVYISVYTYNAQHYSNGNCDDF